MGLEVAPAPVAAHVFGGMQCRVHFDLPLSLGALDVSNWFVRWGGSRRAIASADAMSFNGLEGVRLAFGLPFPEPGPDVVSYSPPPFDLKGLTDVPVAAFADFPITL